MEHFREEGGKMWEKSSEFRDRCLSQKKEKGKYERRGRGRER